MKTESISISSWISNEFSRYWFFVITAIVLNMGFTFGHVMANNNERVFRVSVNKEAAASLSSTISQDEEPVNETLRAHWTTTNEEGNLEGRISGIEPNQAVTFPIEKLNVALLKDGEKVRNSITDVDGKFVLKDVEPGVYTLLASGRNGFLAYGVQVLPKLEDFNILDNDGEARFKTEKSKWSYYVSYFNLPQDALVADELQIDAAAVPPQFSTLKRISQNYLPSALSIAINGDDKDDKATEKAAKIKGGFKLALSETGSFQGRVQPIATEDGKLGKLSEMNVFLIQDDIEAARVAVQENGKFEIENVEPGVYSIVAAGKDGFAALSLELVNNSVDAVDKQVSTAGKTKAYYVSHRAKSGVAAPFTIALATGNKNIKAIVREIGDLPGPKPGGRSASNVYSPPGTRALSSSGSTSSGAYEGLISGDSIVSYDVGQLAPSAYSYGEATVYSAARSGGIGGRGLGVLAVAAGIAIGVSQSDDDPILVVPPSSPVVPVVE